MELSEPQRAGTGRLLAVAIAVGAAAFLISLVFWPISGDASGWLVARYEAISTDPFRRVDYSHRILAPLLAHVLHLAGDGFRTLTLAFSPLLLAGVYVYCRRAGVAAAGSAAIVLGLAISKTIGNSHLTPGLTDTITYFLLLLTLMAVARPYLFWGLFALNLLNHEQIAFILPWLLYVRHGAGAFRVRRDLLCAALLAALYAAFRWYLGLGIFAHHVFYAKRPVTEYLYKYLLVWWFFLTSFGFLLACLFAYASAGRFRRNSVVLCLVCSVLPYALAWDPPRYVHLAYVIVLIAAVDFLRDGRRLPWFLAMLCGNVFIYVASEKIMAALIPRVARACLDAPDRDWCALIATVHVTAPSLVALPLFWWIARAHRAPAPASSR